MRSEDMKNNKPPSESVLLNLFSIHPVNNGYPLNYLVTTSNLNLKLVKRIKSEFIKPGFKNSSATH